MKNLANYAGIIVDVPTMQTNKAYTYKVPVALQEMIQVGMRAAVPFGKGNRLVQGFVISLSAENQDGTHDLKEISNLMDLEPVLSSEALAMSKWMAAHTFSFAIACLQTMIPNAMRASYSKNIVARVPLEELPEEIKPLFKAGRSIDFYDDRITPKLKSQLTKLQTKDQIEVQYQVNDKVNVMRRRWITPLLDEKQTEKELEKVRKNATSQQKLLSFLAGHQKGFWQTKAEKEINISSSVFNSGQKKGWLKIEEREVYRDPFKTVSSRASAPLDLTPDQKRAVAAIDDDILKEKNETFLLQGVTGSGKTEVYLQTIAQAINEGKTALMLVPEISLTPQMVTRVRSRFGEKVAVLHSGLSDGEKYDEWRRIKRQEAKVVVGVRSAVFAPLDNIGLIIMDEEHETSYKQEEMPRYNTRDVAIWRAKWHHCPVVLGSATPSLESRARAQKGVYRWLRLPKRINGKKLPAVQPIDMRQKYKEAPEPDFSLEMVEAIKKRIERQEQVVLMLNRRGFSSFVMCRECGYVLKCPNCDISLTLHMASHTMKCHYCGHEEQIPYYCSNCGSKKIRYYGTGTEKVQQEINRLLPDARVIRMDVDTTRRKGAHRRLLQRFGNHEADILLGTQMIAKGLDFPNVTLVGVLNADTSLSLPNYRSSERTFQLLTQVSGRAGRAEKPGKVLIQTFNPQHYAIQCASRQDYERFFAIEMNVRHQLNYPPYYFTIRITVSAKTEEAAAKEIYHINQELKGVLSGSARIVGPSPQAILKIKKRYYYQLVIKYKREEKLDAYLQKLLVESQKGERQGIRVAIDRDPVNNF